MEEMVNKLVESEYFPYVFGFLFLIGARIQLRKSWVLGFIASSLLKMALLLGGFLNYLLEDYMVGIIMHGLFIVDWVVFKDWKPIFS
ncbi:hypothetical protein [Shimazuella kribbensis]|uniref:hypothetical protein n=1 Tax=Shimazuella kribbensis TaxID=139808 RepID=UPI00041A04CE|nr:hypothetical protein [Shimazuella kribbensis]